MQQFNSHVQRLNVHFDQNNLLAVYIVPKQFQQLACNVNMPTAINTCNDRDYNLIEVLNTQGQCVTSLLLIKVQDCSMEKYMYK